MLMLGMNDLSVQTLSKVYGGCYRSRISYSSNFQSIRTTSTIGMVRMRIANRVELDVYGKI